MAGQQVIVRLEQIASLDNSRVIDGPQENDGDDAGVETYDYLCTYFIGQIFPLAHERRQTERG
jgi:hypothetical protein